MYDNVKKVVKVSSNNIDEINNYLAKGAIILSIDSVQINENSSETSYFYIGLTYST